MNVWFFVLDGFFELVDSLFGILLRVYYIILKAVERLPLLVNDFVETLEHALDPANTRSDISNLLSALVHPLLELGNLRIVTRDFLLLLHHGLHLLAVYRFNINFMVLFFMFYGFVLTIFFSQVDQ